MVCLVVVLITLKIYTLRLFVFIAAIIAFISGTFPGYYIIGLILISLYAIITIYVNERE